MSKDVSLDKEGALGGFSLARLPNTRYRYFHSLRTAELADRNLDMMKRVLATSLGKGLLLLAILLMSATDVLAQDNFGFRGSEPGAIGFFDSENNVASVFNSGDASVAAPGLIVNWVDKGAVTRVKNQGSCESSWAFSATGALEGWGKIEKRHLPSLSEQELVDCVVSAEAQGCLGGDPEAGLMYAMQKGLCHESAYPYRGQVGKCKRCLSPHDKPARIFRIPTGNEELLAEQVARQPVAVLLDGSWYPSYKGGILTGTCGKQLNASALIVGYGVEGQISYWLLKNSLGPNWGEHGYFRLVRGKNQCGIADAAVIPALQ